MAIRQPGQCRVFPNPKEITDEILTECLIYDIETSSYDPETNEFIDISENFEKYVHHAKVKWIGFYSYKYNEKKLIPLTQDTRAWIEGYLSAHKYIIGANNEEFDDEVCKRNGLLRVSTEYKDRYISLDIQKIAGKNPHGENYKQRFMYMGLNPKKYSLAKMADMLNLDVVKGDINYTIFYKDFWTTDEIKEIKTYLDKDIEITKQVFERLWTFWLPFTEELSVKNIQNMSWLRASVASLDYKTICDLFGLDETYNEVPEDYVKEKLGGRAITPKKREAHRTIYVDFASLYPHLFAIFGLFAETSQTEGVNRFGRFKTRGYYDISEPHFLATYIMQVAKKRTALRVLKNPTEREKAMIYNLKIKLNALYGMVRSLVFASVHTPNAGYDCCYLGQQLHEELEIFFAKYGYTAVGGFTDSLFLEHKNGKVDLDEVRFLLDEFIKDVSKDMPFHYDTFDVAIECVQEYLLYNYDYEKNSYPKNNYFYVYKKDGKLKTKFVGLSIMKDGSTQMGMHIYQKYLKPRILSQVEQGLRPKMFTKKFMQEIINTELTENMEKMKIKINCKPARAYKRASQYQAQISKAYLHGGSGSVEIIKNKRFGRAGKGVKYCLVSDMNLLRPDDVILDKVYSELQVFCEEKLDEKKPFIQYNLENFENIATDTVKHYELDKYNEVDYQDEFIELADFDEYGGEA